MEDQRERESSQQGPSRQTAPKSKLIAGILAFFIPGTGHFYLGLMPKGLFIMIAFILNIAAIPYTVINYSSHDNAYIPFVVLLGCLIPVIYFYNLFDALQLTDRVNAYMRGVQLGEVEPNPYGGRSFGQFASNSYFGILLIAVGFFIFIFSAKPAWLEHMFSIMGSYVGAVLLIGAGILLLLSETRKK